MKWPCESCQLRLKCVHEEQCQKLYLASEPILRRLIVALVEGGCDLDLDKLDDRAFMLILRSADPSMHTYEAKSFFSFYHPEFNVVSSDLEFREYYNHVEHVEEVRQHFFEPLDDFKVEL